MLFRLQVAMILGGLFIAFLGVSEFRLSQGTTAIPQEVQLNSVEEGQAQNNRHWKLGEHFAVYGYCVYSYKEDRDNKGRDPESWAKCNYCYYPIVSLEHPFIEALAALEERYGSLQEAPPEEIPLLEDFKVLVKTMQYDTIGDIPDGLSRIDTLQGMVINQINSLDSKEKRLLGESLSPDVLDNVLIIEANRKPQPMHYTLGGALAGCLLAIGGGFFMYRSNRAPPVDFSDFETSNSDTFPKQ